MSRQIKPMIISYDGGVSSPPRSAALRYTLRVQRTAGHYRRDGRDFQTIRTRGGTRTLAAQTNLRRKGHEGAIMRPERASREQTSVTIEVRHVDRAIAVRQ